jgi:uncharacterized protein YutE (UPF0331/DUF86 family)
MADDVILNKAASIARCLQRIEEEYAGNEQNLVGNQTKQDAMVLNLQRTCETAIDLTMYVVSQRKLVRTSRQPRCILIAANRRHSFG